MKTLGYVLGEFPVLSETFIGTEMRSLQSIGYRVEPLAFQSRPEQGQPVDQTMAKHTTLIPSVSRLSALKIWLKNPVRSYKCLRFLRQQTGLSTRSLILSTGQLAYLVNKKQIHHLHAHFALHTAATAIAASKLTRCTVSFVGHGYDVYATPVDLSLKLHQATFAVAVCDDMKRSFQAEPGSCPVHLIACGVDINRYPYQGHSQHNGRLLFVGRLIEKKGLLDLLTALAAIPTEQRPEIDLVGDGPQRQQLEQCCTRLKLHSWVTFLGARPSDWIIENAANYMALCAPFCKAINGDRDTGPVVVKEAMALGLPVITTKFMGCKEILTENTGTLVQPNAPHELKQAITKIQRQRPAARCEQLLRARLRLEQNYSSEITGQRLANAIERYASC
jgi:glycosyltransferase involved in cell wall biosynthesis